MKYQLRSSFLCRVVKLILPVFICTSIQAEPQITIFGVNDGQQVIIPNTLSPQIEVSDSNGLSISYHALLNGTPFNSGTTLSEEKYYKLSVFAENSLGETTNQSVSFSIRKRPELNLVAALASGGASLQANQVNIDATVYVASKAVDNFNIRDVNAYSYKGWILDENGQVMNSHPIEIQSSTNRLIQPLQKQICYEEILPTDSKNISNTTTANCACGSVEEITPLGATDPLSIIRTRYSPSISKKSLQIQNGYAVLNFKGSFSPITRGTPTALEIEGIGYKNELTKYDTYGRIPLNIENNPEEALALGGGVIEPGDGGVEVDPAPKCEWKKSLTKGSKSQGWPNFSTSCAVGGGRKQVLVEGLIAEGQSLEGSGLYARNPCGMTDSPISSSQSVMSNFTYKVYLVGSCEKPTITFSMKPRFKLSVKRENDAASTLGGAIDILAVPSGKKATAVGALGIGKSEDIPATIHFGGGIKVDVSINNGSGSYFDNFFDQASGTIQSSSIIFSGITAGYVDLLARNNNAFTAFTNLAEAELSDAAVRIQGTATCDECDCKSSIDFSL